jgi:hypothetical protein
MMGLERGKLSLRVLPLLAVGGFLGFAGAVHADQDVKSSDGMWTLHAKMADSFAVKKSSEALIDVAPVGMAKGCPAVSSVVFEMPAHGHGGSVDPMSMSSGTCQWHVTDLNPSMGGEWRLRLVLKAGDKTSNADFTVNAK